MISHHISLLCRLHAKFQIPTHPFKCHTVALKTVLTDLDWCRLSTLIFFHHILNVAFCYIVLLQLSHCVFSASFAAVENDLAWELRGFLFFLRPLLINNRITVGHLLMARNWNQKCSLCVGGSKGFSVCWPILTSSPQLFCIQTFKNTRHIVTA